MADEIIREAQKRLEAKRSKFGSFAPSGGRTPTNRELWQRRLERMAPSPEPPDMVGAPTHPTHHRDGAPVPPEPKRQRNRRKSQKVTCTNCSFEGWAVLSKKHRLRNRPCPECGGRVRLASWPGFKNAGIRRDRPESPRTRE